MSQFVRYFEHMRPRFSNPTYNSSHVGSSLGLFLSPQVQSKSQQRHSKIQQYGRRDHFSDYGQNFNSKNESVNQFANENPYDIIPSTLQKQRSKSHSRLQNYGTSSLSTLPKQISDRDIYEKQAKKYNIISVKPLQHQQTIKKYPKYHLENLDANFYKKLQLQDEYRYPSNNANRFGQIDPYQISKKQEAINNLSNPESYQTKMTKNVEPKKEIASKAQSNIEPKEVSNLPIESSSKNHQIKNEHQMGERQNSEFLRAKFRAKMLNNVDELGGLI